MNDFTCEYFINKFANIEDKYWTIAQLSTFDGTKHCAIGWCGGYDSEETKALAKLFIKHFAIQIDDPELFTCLREDPSTIVYMVNDNDETYGIKLHGTTPKSRIINVLTTIQRKQLQEGNIKEVKKIISNSNPCSNEKTFANKRQSRNIPINS